MKVAMYYRNDDVRIEEMPKPEISADELLIKINACGICGTDILEWYRIKKAPLVLGHEIAGVIEESGANIQDYKKGQRVFVSHHVPCNECHYCKRGMHTACETLHTTNFSPGGFAEYIRVPKINIEKGGVLVLPDTVSDEEATMIEPLGCALRGQKELCIKQDSSVLVLGSGIAGLLHVKLAKLNNASNIIATDLSEYRLEKAKEFGADHTFKADGFTPEKLKQVNNNLLADFVILCTGAVPAVEQAINSVAPGGTIMFFAVPKAEVNTEINLSSLWRNNVSFKTSYAAAPYDLKKALELIQAKKIIVSDMITNTLPLEKAQEGFQLVASAGDSLKVVLKPQF